MNPDLAAAIPRLVEDGILPPDRAAPLLREARGERLPIRAELRALLYLGVLVTMAGVGLLVEANLARIGPLVIAAVLGLAAAAVWVWVARAAPPFAWHEVPSPNLAFDYLLLLGVLLAAADLAYVEVLFAPLGAFRAWHLLIVAFAAAAAAVRFDSRVVFSLALTTFAAWRGVALGPALALGRGPAYLRWNAVGCGVLFAGGGWLLARARRKAHFEPVAVNLGWLLILLGAGSGMAEDGHAGDLWAGVLFVVGAALAAGAFRARRFPLFAYGVVAAYVGITRILVSLPVFPQLGCLWFGGSSIAILAGLYAAQRALRPPRLPVEAPAGTAAAPAPIPPLAPAPPPAAAQAPVAPASAEATSAEPTSAGPTTPVEPPSPDTPPGGSRS